MSANKHWVKVQIGDRLEPDEGWKLLWNEIGPDRMADLAEFMFQLSGNLEERTDYVNQLRGKFEDDPETVGVQALRRAAMLKHFRYLENHLSEDWKKNADLETFTFYMEYDPKEWFSGTGSWLGYPSGRMVALAYTGALKRMGFKVSGSNLPAEVCSE